MCLSDEDISEDDYSEDYYSEEYTSEDDVVKTARIEQFSKLFHEIERCREVEQIQKIDEMIELIDEMEKKEFESIFIKELFDKIHQMIEKEKLSWGHTILLLKNAGCFKELKCLICYSFDDSLLSKRIREMMIDENEKKKDEKLLTDLCECYLLLHYKCVPDELLSIIVPCLLKAALNKEENEESQKEVEMAFIAFSHISQYCEIEQELYLNEIVEIIEYHQENYNLTRLSSQSTWQFLIKRFNNDKSLEEVIVNDLHFAREARREIEELKRNVDWKKKEEENGETEAKEVIVIWRWINIVDYYLAWSTLWNEELAGLIRSIVQVFRASRDNYPDTNYVCIVSLKDAARNKNVKIDVLHKEGTMVVFSDEMKQSTLVDDILWNCLLFFLNISRRLKEKKDDEKEEEERKEMKRKIFERMEEEGYEDNVESLNGVISFINEKYYEELSLKFSDYFVNV
ncbi:uncharacterized protein MONOS_8532 [Monocercomonoides exilis]|uniref:uncharacterized protein n=1 Tax=Monocercomonoides exilis TaxID=2049356 RepID=UPI0035597708|nr:hypothetical protein MONOS_8532 [Monocercomonoides exilis]|eukprot:MONOS_8532.1-p1 / transcript=MONOS_8532.1 / gene=MONOS_8532 / organism=Monocercomonoides_exilis_PA203 / gene_product=unspecified product / transcript_product=unspecified product / location=Mono_scaffold00324:28860-30358(-) / protein_length=457 / sequence_SO=supercontig / SO=protein_coding / is_pseudo=false